MTSIASQCSADVRHPDGCQRNPSLHYIPVLHPLITSARSWSVSALSLPWHRCDPLLQGDDKGMGSVLGIQFGENRFDMRFDRFD